MSNLKSRYEKCLDLPSVKSAILSCELGDLDVSSDRREELEKIVSEDPTKLQEKFELSQIYVSLNRHDDALEHLIEIIKVFFFIFHFSPELFFPFFFLLTHTTER